MILAQSSRLVIKCNSLDDAQADALINRIQPELDKLELMMYQVRVNIYELVKNEHSLRIEVED